MSSQEIDKVHCETYTKFFVEEKKYPGKNQLNPFPRNRVIMSYIEQ